MKKWILLAACGVLILWLSIGIAGTAQHESASDPSTQDTGDGPYTAQTDGPETTTLTPELPNVTVPSAPISSEVVSSPPVSSEVAPSPPDDSSEVIASEPLPDNDHTVTLIYQNPELPNGCEITSLAILLDWAGYPIDKVELSNGYLPKQEFSISDGIRVGADPDIAYVGDPSSPNGWYCFERPILEAGNAYLSDQNSRFRAVSFSRLTQEEIDFCLDAGVPMAVWVTLRYNAPKNPSSFSWYLSDGTHYIPYSNLHCVVLAGKDDDGYRIADPISGWLTVSSDVFWSCFDAMGHRAVALVPA